MQAVERLSSYITQGVYTVSGPFHPFGGAVDIIVVEQQDGSFKCSPWYVRFGKFQGVLNAREKVVNISVNGAEAGFHMYLDNKGEAYFLKGSDPDDEELVSSPPTSGDETDEGSDSKGERSRKNQGCDFESKRTESISQIDVENVKIVARTNSKRSRIFGLVFGRRSTKEDPANQNVPRLNSLERAEIAADLLETKWSTNLPTTNLRDRKAQSTSAVKVDKETNTVGEQKSSAVSLRSEDLGSPEEVKNLISGAEVVNQEVFGEVKDQVPSSLRAHNEIIEICRSEKGDMVGRHEVFSDLPHDANTHEFDSGLENSAGSTENDTGFQSSEFGMLCDGTEKVSEDQELKLIARSSVEEDRDREEASYIFYEAFQTETVRFNVAHHQTIEPSATSLDKNDVAKSTGEVVFETIELVSEVVPGSVTSASGVEEKPANSSEHGSIERPAAGNNVQEDCVHGGNFMNETACRSLEPYISDAEQIEAESPLDMRSLNYEYTSEATQQEISKDERPCEKSGEDVKSVDVFENQLKVDTMSGNCHSHRTCFEVAQPFGASEESQCMPIFPISISSGCEEIRDVTEGVKTDTHNLSGEVSIAASPGFNAGLSGIEAENASHSLSKLPEVDLFLFSDVDNHGIDGISSQFINEEEVDSEEPMCAPEEGAEEHELNNINSEYSMNLYEPKKSQTSPIDIPCRTQWEETDRKIRSLPNVPSQILQMGTSDVCLPLSRSVQLSSQISDLGICKEEFPSSLKLEAGYGSNLPQAEAASETADVDVNQPSSITKNLNAVGPAVELSLCKHLLFEGMGAEAASRAFDAEKVDLEKFTALGPSVVKNNRLIVRIGGRYLSWDEAQYVILGMVSFGKDHIFDFEGIKVEKTPDEGTSSAIAPSGGSWRLWPFSFKKSRTLRIEHNIPRENKEKDAITASEDGLSGLSKAAQPRPIKRRERSLTPSSRQLASLNLREGRNLVTFSFETAMLGRQQVDARIYLWKWNTRVVISDVDGTITKSDVLGQFMPLVGKDWSQTGVVHLFSSIKENGYQFLFLSARAIAQAYITRQFLFNLKQDGKALPDGPVVISPDGLFPSLYREVIRRAPHEFKIACLEDIRALFPPDCNPFYAGFGNRHTDEISYLKVGIPKGKIFIINPKGEVAVNSRLDMKSYTSLNALVNGMFPPTTSVEQEDFNSWNYWKLPLPVVDC